MDKFSAELLERIRAAVIKKLREMERYVDNELSDYIMILVANKRTMSHMQKDLSLFLGKNTIDFTHWLFDMVAHLKKGTSKTASCFKITNTPITTDKNKSDEDVDVLDYDLGEQEGDLLYQDDSLLNKPSASTGLLTSKVQELQVPTVKPTYQEETVKDLDKRKVTQKSVKVYPVQPICTLPPSSTAVQVEQPKSFPEDEYDPTKPEFIGGVSSVVRVTRKNYSRPPALQANKLLLRAVDDATKSVLDGRSVNEYYRPTPIKMLPSTKPENSYGSRSHNLVSVKIDSNLNFDADSVLKHSEISTIETKLNESSVNFSGSENCTFSSASQNSRTICMTSKQSDINVDDAVQSFPFQMDHYSTINIGQEEEEVSPHFIVTLDGVDLPSLKRKFTDSEESMDIDEEFLVDEDEETIPNEKRKKVIERCKYWPLCKNNESCTYYHPCVPCQSFPDCKYGDKCIYIHPTCKFDSRCSRKDCPYTHVGKKKFPLSLVANRPVKIRNSKMVCKFYPKCTVKHCTFIHPKLCRFGTRCRLPTCLYTHVSIPSRNQMKWKANTSDDF